MRHAGGTVLLGLCLLLPGGLGAQGQAPLAPLILTLPISVRSAGLGGASVALNGDASATFLNPAGLATIQHIAVEGAVQRYPDGSLEGFAAGAFRILQFDLGGGVHYLRLSDTSAVADNLQWTGSAVYRFGLVALGSTLRYVSLEDSAGAVRRSAALDLPSRHLGLVQAEENQGLETFIESAAAAVSCETDFNRLLTIASQLTDESGDLPAIRPLGQRIAVARDAAFAFIYPHLLKQWREAGAEILPFSPLNEEAPDASCDAVFLPGGYPELHAGRLAANHGFLAGLKASKGLVYGECGGFMVLGEELIDGEGHRHRMAGLLPVVTSFATRKLNLGYRSLTPLPGAPWSKPLRGHEFHYSTISSEGYAERLFAADSAVFENGGVEGSYANYLARHLGPELGHFRSFRFTDHRLDLWCEGRIAVATETYNYRIERSEGDPIERRGVTTSVLRRAGGSWQIVNMHGSSRVPRPPR